MKRRSFTLLEVLIATALAAVLLSLLGYFWRQMEKSGQIVEKMQIESFQMRSLQARLSDIFPKISSKALFFTAPPLPDQMAGTDSLIFEFDNCVRLDKEFAYIVTGRLYLNTNGQLILFRLPSKKFWKTGELPHAKKEVLAENVSSLKFRFFVAPDKNKVQEPTPETPVETEGQTAQNLPKKEAKEQMNPALRLTWVQEWKRVWEEIPAVIRLEISREKEPILFGFPLPNQPSPITYKS